MLTVNTLKSYTAKDLAQMAKKRGISGWNAMKKDELVKALARTVKSGAKSGAKPEAKTSTKTSASAKAAKPLSPSAAAKTSPGKRPAAPKLPAAKLPAAKAPTAKAPTAKAPGGRGAAVKAAATKSSARAKAVSGKAVSEKLESVKAKTKEGTGKPLAPSKPAPSKPAPQGKVAAPQRNGSVPEGAQRDSSNMAPAKSNTVKGDSAKPTVEATNGASNNTSAKNGETKQLNGNSGAHRTRGRVPEPPKPKSKGVIRRIQQVHQAREAKMDLATTTVRNGATKSTPTEDRIVLLVRDPYWLQANWELTPRCVERAQAALKERWHTARPVLRLLSISNNNVSNNPECVIRIINIHGAVHNWFIDVQDPPHSYRVEIGYLTSDDHFYGLARSNPVTTPRPGSADMMENNWADLIENPEKVFALSGGYDDQHATGELQTLFEERLRRPMGSPMMTRFGNGAEGALNRDRDLQFTIDAEMVVYGVTHPNAYVTMSGEPIKLRDDGTFVARVSLPDRRQVIPIVASSGDGVEERTIVLAIEKNTKVMEPKTREPGE